MSGACLLLSSSSLVGRKVVEVSPARRLMVPIPDFRCCVVQELEEGEIVEETVWPYLPPPPPADPRGRRFIFLALAIFCCLIFQVQRKMSGYHLRRQLLQVRICSTRY